MFTMENKLEFKIPEFEGPLDLLLHLIERNKFNIFDIPILEITEQYLDYLNRMQEENLDIMSEFLVMAATLIRIRAKMLLPEDKEEEIEEDPRAELVRRLLEYKMYKYASYELKDMELDAGRVYYKEASIPKEVLEFKEEKHDLSREISESCQAALVRIIGNIAIFYRPAEKQEKRKFNIIL